MNLSRCCQICLYVLVFLNVPHVHRDTQKSKFKDVPPGYLYLVTMETATAHSSRAA